MQDVLGSHFSQMSDEQIKAQQASANQASSESRAQKIGVPGKYLMKVKTTIFKAKESGDVVVMPRVEGSDKGTVSLVVGLEVVDGTQNVPEGSYISAYIILLTAPSASAEKALQTYNFSKPRLCALTGLKDVIIDKDWITDHFLIDYVEDAPGKFTVTRDHKMKSTVYVTVEIDTYNNKETLKVKDIQLAKATDKSIEFDIGPVQDTTSVSAPSASSAPVSAGDQAIANGGFPASKGPSQTPTIDLTKSDSEFNPAAAANSAVNSYEDA
jgi:hypothetical protein